MILKESICKPEYFQMDLGRKQIRINEWEYDF